MNNILGWTTEEQAQKLIYAGISLKTNDMQFYKRGEITQIRRIVNRAIEQNIIHYHYKDLEPCWSLGRLIELAESYDGAKVSYDDHCWQIRQGDIHCIGESLPDVFIEFLKRRKEKK